MRVVLLKNVEKLGLAGDVCDVAEGHARNFLFPKKLATPATLHALADAERLRQERAHVAELDLERVEHNVERLDGFELEIAEKANEGGTLFAAVTKEKIVAALHKKGLVLQAKNIVLEHAIKEVGEYDVRCTFPHGLEAMLHVIITASE